MVIYKVYEGLDCVNHDSKRQNKSLLMIKNTGRKVNQVKLDKMQEATCKPKDLNLDEINLENLQG